MLQSPPSFEKDSLEKYVDSDFMDNIFNHINSSSFSWHFSIFLLRLIIFRVATFLPYLSKYFLSLMTARQLVSSFPVSWFLRFLRFLHIILQFYLLQFLSLRCGNFFSHPLPFAVISCAQYIKMSHFVLS